MKTSLIHIFIFLIFCSCSDIIEKNTPENIFEVFWRTLDENYVYFEEKGIDWDSIYKVYSVQAKNAVNDDDLIKIFSEIIPLFKDKHLNISKNRKLIRYINCEQDTTGTTSYGADYGVDYEYAFKNRYFKDNPLRYSEDSIKHIAYVAISTFDYSHFVNYDFIDPNLDKALNSLNCSNGLIIDLRNNCGGKYPTVTSFVSAFFTGKKVLSYHQNKTGKGHNDFSNKIPTTTQGKGYVADSVPIVILTSTYTYSAANLAVYMLKDLRPCTIIGEATSGGGGGGGRKDVILPNGWDLSFPCHKTFSPSGKNMEYRFEPDIYVKHYARLDDDKGHMIRKDTVLIKAIEFLDNLQTQ